MMVFLKKLAVTVLIQTILVSMITQDIFSQARYPMEFQKGVCYVAWEKDKYCSRFSDASLERLAETGTEWISIIVTWYQDDVYSTEITPTERTPSDRSLMHAIAKARQVGLKVMLKPHVDLASPSGYWRGDICQNSDEGWRRWFESYQKFILRYAGLARAADVEIFCIGTELVLTTDRTHHWEEIIRTVRTVYEGPVTYAAHWDGEFENIEFWKDLDYVGIDAYFPLADGDAPDLQEIKSGWKKWIDAIDGWIATVNKPVIFTEAGYSSTPGAAQFPWEEKSPGNVDLEVQRDCYRALFEILWDKKWFSGVYWWRWSTNARAGGCYNKGFTPQNKPAEEILVEWYGKNPPRMSRPKRGLSFEL